MRLEEHRRNPNTSRLSRADESWRHNKQTDYIIHELHLIEEEEENGGGGGEKEKKN